MKQSELACRNSNSLLLDQLHGLGDSQLAASYSLYFRNSEDFLGVPKLAINQLCRSVVGPAIVRDSPEIWLPIWKSNWKTNIHEVRSATIVCASYAWKHYDSSHLERFFFSWIRSASAWDHIDELCICLVGRVALEIPDVLHRLLDFVCTSSELEVRAGMVAQLPSIRQGRYRLEILRRALELAVDDRRKFVTKSAGWTLRELSTICLRDAVILLTEFSGGLSRSSLREAMRKMPADLRANLWHSLAESS